MILIINNAIGQNRLNGIVLDYDTKKSIEYVDVYNRNNFTLTNSEGCFLFISENDSIKIRLIGYKPISTTFKEIKSDTIFLKSEFQKLDEVVLSNGNFFNKIKENILSNYPFEPYTESFFLRCFIRKNRELLKIQDLNGLVKRQTLFATKEKPMPKKNYEVSVLNVRKAGIYEGDVYFKMFNFYEILQELASVSIDKKSYNFSENSSADKSTTKYSFYPNETNKSKYEGYYLLNSEDKAFTEFYLKRIDTTKFVEKKIIKYRTTNFEKLILFKKNEVKNKYFIDKAKIFAEVEVIDESGKTTIYNAVYNWISLEQNNQKLKKKHSIKKEIFKFKKPYNSVFWEDQEYLLLTNEMENFLKKLENSNGEFKTVTNLKK